MRHFIRGGGIALVVAMGVGQAAAQIPGLPGPQSKSSNYLDTDCAGLKLMAAAGVPKGPVRKYDFQGPCSLLQVTATNKSGVFGIGTSSDRDVTVVASVWAKAGATWDSRTGELREYVSITGPRTGTVEMQLRCGSDPVLTGVACVQVAYQNTTGWTGFDRAWIGRHPITRGKTSLGEASALSMQGASNKPPPPPAPKPSPSSPPGTTRGLPPPSPSAPAGMTRGLPTPFVIEIESLAGAAQATSGLPGVQPMAGFKPGWWGADAQLFWPATQVGAQLRLQPFIPRPGRYNVFLIFTAAPDYAITLASFDGQQGVVFNGFAPGVSRDRIRLGVFDLTAGTHELLIQVRGKDAKSTGFFIGLDQLVFEPN